ncbi:MAG: chorismate pyruvate-lyase family protein [Candidatus Poribacteria bacterium]|jgi:chorismate-pyruvate lyase
MSNPERLPFGTSDAEGVFVAQSSRPSGFRALDLRLLTPFHRALLVIDGTVTQFIEAYTYEPIAVIRVRQERQRLTRDHEWLDAVAGTEVIARDVVLRGEASSTLYVYGISLTVVDRLPEGMSDQLDLAGESIGRLLREYRVETYRELLWCGLTLPDELPMHFVDRPTNSLMSRAYRLIANDRPVMHITEMCPVAFD